jgi:hypothetical protein
VCIKCISDNESHSAHLRHYLILKEVKHINLIFQY